MGRPCGTFDEIYETDRAIFRTRLQWILFACGTILAFLIPFYCGAVVLSWVILIFIMIIGTQGINILAGYSGQISIAQAAFMGIGAYTTAILANRFGLPVFLTLPLSAVTAGSVGVLLGFPSLRLKGFYLAISTLAAQFIIVYVIRHWTSVTGGAMGYFVPAAKIGGFTLNNDKSFYFLVYVVLFITTYFAANLTRSKVGRALIAIRDNDLAAEVMGINQFRYKLLAFFIGCAYAGISGSLWAYWNRAIDPDQFGLMISVWFLGYAIVGGLGTNIGPFFGAASIIFLTQGVSLLLTNLATIWPTAKLVLFSLFDLIFGAIVVLFLIFEPRGLSHRWELIKSYYRLWPFAY
jgi:branched-chain amino acid transport system permease protein